MANLSLLLDHLKVDKLSTDSFVCFFFYVFLLCFYIQKNVNTVGHITYKDNEHWAVKCIVLHSPGTDSGLLEKDD